MSNTESEEHKESHREKRKRSFSHRLKIFSMKFLAHHPACYKFDNHIFKLGSLMLCVGCTSVILGFILYTIVFFSFFGFFRGLPILSGIIAAFGVGMALIQVFLKPKNKWLKSFFRLCLGIGLGAYTNIIVLAADLFNVIGNYIILVQITLFVLLIPGIYLYNILRGDSPYLECKECEEKFIEPTCDYNVVSNHKA
ncbi:MAG: hypothetical protein GOP50_02350 [Candidatus Heimdallarchaeota archaeon]|nr:hypothetical protein [Candidatus Heimdallarchaeota archaeon]